MKVAVTLLFALAVITHVPVPLQPDPLQAANVDPAEAVAVSVTTVPVVNFEEHVPPQLMPAGDDVTLPVPVPVLVTVILDGGAAMAGGAIASSRTAKASASPVRNRIACLRG